MVGFIYKDDGVSVFSENGRYFITYDAGSHQICRRKDEISRQQVDSIKADPNMIETVLFELQRKLTLDGVDPYQANL